MAIILCIETATDACSVAVGRAEELLAEEHISEGMRHSSALTQLIDKVMSRAGLKAQNLDGVAISDGPGSYTGLRVGASTAKAICYAHEIPLIAISTLEALADHYEEGHPIMTTLDARRMEVYAAIYRDKKELLPVKSVIWTEEEIKGLLTAYPNLSIVGTGVNKAKELFESLSYQDYQEVECRASHLLRPAYLRHLKNDVVDIAYHSPFYFKMPNITVSKPKI